MNKLIFLVSLIVLLLLLLLLFNNRNMFGDILGEDDIVVLETKDRNMLDFTFRYSTPALPSLPGRVSTSFYKWPLLYLIDPTGSTFTSQTLSGEYTKPPPKALLNIDYISYGETGINYYSPGNDIKPGYYFPNIINLNELLNNNSNSGSSGINNTNNNINNNLKPSVMSPFVVSGDTIPEKTQGGWILQGLSSIINTPLVPERTYILGIALQLTNNYINIQGNTRYTGVRPIIYRYGNFSYTELKYSLSGLSITGPDGITPEETTFSLTI
jgi:hypothetical protein